MTLLTAKKELVVIHELVAGTSPTGSMTDAANADVLLNTAEPTFDVEFIDREFLRTTLTKIKSLPGQKTGGVTMTFEMLGNVDDTFAAGVPAWSKLIEMSGFRLAVIGKATANQSQSSGWDLGDGPLRHGELITDNSGNVARLVGDVHPGQRIFYFEAVSGTMTDVVTTGTPWVTGDTEFTVDMTSGTVLAQAGWAWIPITEPLKSFDSVATGGSIATTGSVYEGSIGAVITIAEDAAIGATTIIYRPGIVAPVDNEVFTLVVGSGPTITVAATVNEQFTQWPTASVRLNEDGVAVDFVASRGNVSFGFEVNRPVVATVTTRGRWDSGDSGSDLNGVGDTPLLNGAPVVVDPKLWAGRAIGIGLNETLSEQDLVDEETPCLKTLTLDAGVTLTDNQCAGSEDGLLEILGSSKSASGSLEANATLETEIPWLTTLRSGEVVRLRVHVGGSLTTNENGFQFLMPALQHTGAASGDSDGILTRNMDFSLNAGVMNNLGTSSPDGEISSISGDNEIIIIYQVEV